MNPSIGVLEQSTPFRSQLCTETLEAYHAAREAIHAYCYCSEFGQRREIALQVVEALESFLQHDFSGEELALFETQLADNRRKIRQIGSADSELFYHLESLDSDGVALLDLPREISLPMLKKRFRQACFKHHPDVGGSNETMQRINQAYALFHEAITSYIPHGADPEQTAHIAPGAESWNDWLYSLHLVLSCIHGDFFAADVAFPHLEKAIEHARRSSDPFIGQFAASLTGVVDRTCRALGRFQMRREFDIAVDLTAYLGDCMFKHYVPQGEFDERPERAFFPSRRDLMKEFGVRIVLRHPEQAKNAHRLGRIDDRRYRTAMKRFAARATDQEAINRKLDGFIASEGFVTLPSGKYSPAIRSAPQVIPPPSFFQRRFDDLEEEQRWEYVKAFGSHGNSHLVRKYSRIRVTEILLALVHDYESLDHSRLEPEIDFFCSAIESEDGPYHLVSRFFHRLMGLDRGERNRELHSLTKVDDPYWAIYGTLADLD